MELKFQVTHHICSNFLPFVFMHSLSQVCTTQKMFLKLVWDLFFFFFSNDAMILCWISMHKHRNYTVAFTMYKKATFFSCKTKINLKAAKGQHQGNNIPTVKRFKNLTKSLSLWTSYLCVAFNISHGS